MTKQEVRELARAKMNQWGLFAWEFKFDRASRRAGCCFYQTATITLSHHYALNNPYEEVLDTILHEIAHALTPGHHHDWVWRMCCVKIGARPNRCYDSTKVNMPKGQCKAVCGSCSKEFFRHRVPKRNRYCLACGPVNGLLNFANPPSESSLKDKIKELEMLLIQQQIERLQQELDAKSRM